MRRTLSHRDLHEQLARLIGDRDADDLRELLRALADDCHPAERVGFLERLRRHLDRPSEQPGAPGEDLGTAIRDLAGAIEAVIADADDALLIEDDEDPLGPFGPLMPEVEDLLWRIAARVDSGDAGAARGYYEQVWALLDRENDFGCRPSLEEHDLDQAREHAARYLRAVYLAAAPAERPAALRAAAEVTRFSGFPDRPQTMYLTLREIAEVDRQPLPDWERALDRLIEELTGDDEPLGDLWLREAVSTRRGTAGLAALARRDGAGRPNAWLDWADSAVREGDDAAALDACRCADAIFPPHALIRASLADVAGPAVDRADPETRAWLRGAALLADPGLRRLLELWEAYLEPEERDNRLKEAASVLATAEPTPSPPPDYRSPGSVLAAPRRSGPTDRATAAFAYLLAGDWDSALALARDSEPLGWSSGRNAQAAVFAYALVALQGGDPAAVGPVTAGTWNAARRVDPLYPYFPDAEEAGDESAARSPDSVPERLDQAVAHACTRHPLPVSETEAWMTWCLTIARQRCAAIVANKFRKAYPRAARVVAASYETAAARGADAQGQRLVDDLCRRFSRHSAFQREMRAALAASRETG